LASILFLNHSIDRHSSRNLPLKDSLLPFCQGFPGSMCAVSMFAWVSLLRGNQGESGATIKVRELSGAWGFRA
jgi:hypothetical protein